MAVECDAGLSAAQWPFESSFANLVRLAPQILAIELKQVEGKRQGQLLFVQLD